MSALTVDPAPGQEWDDLVRIWEETDAPEGCKVEIIEGIVTVSPPPSKDHNTTAELLQRRLYGVIPEDWGIYQTLGVSLPGRAGLYIPDLVVVPRAVATGPGNRIPAEETRLVVEIASQANANHDRIGKVHGCAKAGVELFLLLDPWHSGRPTATLYGESDGGTYRVLDTVEYGEKLTLPEPFGLVLDTGVFPVS
ncbi:Uma2 family endonuclease [Streptomyces sp. NBC_00257]|uniref:Uma2 family endonuclease n=1 Tax=unclassified Streptomyces TaxID=2593676 RepID=UPI002256A593|nr:MULTISPECIES: Uma2 family endonuclease [unclassified Streptomyces]MCX4864945.1 Uma2 family endonuclease [Streptomyces sp. NBC_00906]MCX4896183.1 Uma2 family endonuclease [Streptomyces sp. NBC_00892]MCX5429472.1 Uma2 family endonuclease [Streptomyces sp. NBC_00062]